MIAIFLKEIKSNFKSLFGWIYLAAFLFFANLYFNAVNINAGNPYMADSLSAAIIIAVFLLPLLTMRIIAEEKKQKTDQFLITAPISLVKVILGKYFALCAIMAVTTVIAMIPAFLIAISGSVPMAQNLMAYLAFFLFGCECIAIGMFLSSVTEHQFLAAIFTYVVYIFILLAPGFVQSVFGSDKLITKVLSAVDIYGSFNSLMSGVFDVTDLVFVVSVIAIFLILSYKVFAKNSVQLSALGRNQYFLASLLPFAIIFAIVGVNFGVTKIPSKYTSFDITKEKWYSLTDDTKQLLGELDEEVTINVWGVEGDVDDHINHYLDEYDLYPNIKVRYISIAEYPDYYKKFMEYQPYPSTLFITKGNDFRVVEYSSMFEFTVDQSYQYSIVGLDIEGEIDSAIHALMYGDDVVNVCMLNGHGEKTLPLYPKDLLNKGNFVFNDIYLYENEVPSQCDILLINAPDADFTDSELNALMNYVERGGKMIFIAPYCDVKTPNIDKFLSEFGITMTEGVVFDDDYTYKLVEDNPQAIFGVISESSDYAISSNKKCLFCFTRGFLYDADNMYADVSINDIFCSGPYSYSHFLEPDDTVFTKKEGDLEGPFALATSVRKFKSDGSEPASIVLIGSPEFLTDDYDSYVAHGNSELFANICKNIVEKEGVVLVPTKLLTYDYIRVDRKLVIFYVLFGNVVLPLGLIIAGITILIIRRRK